MKILAYGADMTIMQPIKIAAISDMHGELPSVPPCDILLIAGDICPSRNHKLDYQEFWLGGAFRKFLEECPAKEIYGVAGNHDFIFQYAPENVPDDLKWTYLQDNSVVSPQFGIKIHGTPWQNWFGDWAFNAPKIDGQSFLAERYELIEPDTDVLISHGPPFGYGDGMAGGKRTGSEALMYKIEHIKPKLVIVGHIHVDHGLWNVRWGKNGKEGKTVIANVSVTETDWVRHAYVLTREAMVFDMVFDK